MLYIELDKSIYENIVLQDQEIPENLITNEDWNLTVIEIRSPEYANQFLALSKVEKQKFTVFVARQCARRLPELVVWMKLDNSDEKNPYDILSQPAEFFFQTEQQMDYEGEDSQIWFYQNGTKWWDKYIRVNYLEIEDIPDGHEHVVYNIDDHVYRTDKRLAKIVLPVLNDVITKLLDLRFSRFPRYQILTNNSSFIQMLKSVVETEKDLEPNFQGSTLTRKRSIALLNAEKNRTRREAMMIFLLQQNTIPSALTSQFPFPGSPQEFLNGLKSL